jgi:hypothetical protein
MVIYGVYVRFWLTLQKHDYGFSGKVIRMLGTFFGLQLHARV